MAIILFVIIVRPERTSFIESCRKWVLVYGRRKTGKTFILRNFVRHDEYFFVKKDRNILTADSTSIGYDTFIELLKRGLKDGRTIVVDEFHRLGDDFFDFLHSMKKSGKLILVSSTLFLSKKLISKNSALLGLFAEAPVDLIGLDDTLVALKESRASKKERVELAVLLREPIAIDYFDKKKSARETISQIIRGSVRSIPALTGEIFTEEQRDTSAVYEGILRAVAAGRVSSGEVSSHLFSRRLIKKDDPSVIQQYLGNLVLFGILRKIQVFGKKRYIYKIASPLARIFYYADEKYNISERNVPERELARIIDEIVPRIVEDEVRSHMARRFGLRESVIEATDYEVDGCLLRFGKPEIVLEVKWKKLKGADISATKSTLSRVTAKRKILFVQDKTGVKVDGAFEILDVDDI